MNNYHITQEVKDMANNNSNRSVVPEAKEALNKFKYEVASEVGVNLKQGYNGDLSARDAGRIGGQMVKKLIQQAENQMKQFLFRNNPCCILIQQKRNLFRLHI